MPPVTALRSPPASRITGADSPVIADSSTDAMPSITVPSPGISSPASTTTTSPRPSSDAGFVVAVTQARAGLGPHRPQRVGLRRPRPSASASARFANTTVSQSQIATVNVNQAGSSPPPSGCAAEGLDQPGDRRDQRADLDHEHHGVAHHLARGSSFPRLAITASRMIVAGRAGALGAAVVIARCLLVERPGSAPARSRRAPRAHPRSRSSVCSSTSCVHSQQVQAGARARHTAGLDASVGLGDVRVDTRRRRGDRVHGDVGRPRGRRCKGARASM